MRLVLRCLALSCLGTLGMAGTASAASLLTGPVSAASAVDRSCAQSKLSSGAGYVQRTVTMPSPGAVTARLNASGGDWDVAVFEADTGQVVAGSAYSGSREVASGYAIAGERLVVQACRLSGSVGTASLNVDSTAVDTSGVQPSKLVRVSTPTLARRNELASLGLDVTEHGGPGFLEVVLHGASDASKLSARNFTFTVEVPDLALAAKNDRSADSKFANAYPNTELPSGRNTYRRLFDYSEDMKRLAREHPDLVRPITLGHLTYEGRPVEGIEIATNPTARDGRPVFLQMGLHHAREWPSGEHAMEWAYELVLGYRHGDARVRKLVQNTRTIVVPVINPDGFNASREAGQLYLNGDGADTDADGSGDISDPEFLLAAATHPNEYRRKNCRLIDDSPMGNCNQPSLGAAEPGVDPNRNYGGFWGGPGADTNPLIQTYRGPAPFSEPETRNVRDLVSTRQVTTLITNHTFSNLVLRPPGVAAQGSTPDETIYKSLGASMAAENGYANQYGYELYDTTGTTEDWSYWSTGGLGYTFEIGDLGFHPPFAETVGEWNGTTDDATGGGNRAAYYHAQENTANAARHSVIAGQAPAGAVLRLKKTFETPTFSGSTFTDTLDTTVKIGSNGVFDWHVNPSTRPLVVKGSGRAPTGTPSAPKQFASRGGTTPCADIDNPPPGCYEDHLVTVPSGTGIDNAKATFRVEFPAVSDWDMKVYRADSSGKATGDPLFVSGNGATNLELGYEEGIVLNPVGSYVVRVINYAAVGGFTGTVTFAGPEPYQAPQQETWTLFCEQPEGTIRSARQVYVARGQKRTFDLRTDCKIRR
ncbi:MAG TPA: M14 family metallopeptidase [Thermoleophilaceae bacterium]|nr:M14 family metallopeptidase [Thermoleophilaceae bacterium]